MSEKTATVLRAAALMLIAAKLSLQGHCMEASDAQKDSIAPDVAMQARIEYAIDVFMDHISSREEKELAIRRMKQTVEDKAMFVRQVLYFMAHQQRIRDTIPYPAAEQQRAERRQLGARQLLGLLGISRDEITAVIKPYAEADDEALRRVAEEFFATAGEPVPREESR